MKRYIFFFPTILVFCLGVFGQVQEAKLTVEEEKAFTDIRRAFIEKMDATGTLDPLVADMFVPDFGARYAKEQKADLASSTVKPESIMFAPGLEFTPNLLDEASGADWQELHLASFDFLRITAVATINRAAAAQSNGHKVSDEEFDEITNGVVSKEVVDLFAKDPNLKNFIESEERSEPIRNVADMRRVSKLLREALAIVIKKAGGDVTHYSAKVKKAQEDTLSRANLAGARVEIADRETYGFPKGTRLITFFADASTAVIFTKVGDQYKIVAAAMSSID